MDKKQAMNIAKKYASAVRKTFSVCDIILYGSYARGTATENSDIDIAVIVDQLPNDYLSAASLLWKLTREIDDGIEPVLLTADDDASGFLTTVRNTGIAI